MFEVVCVLAVAGGLCFMFGVIYPLCALMFYPIYKRTGGTQSFKEYMKTL